MIPRSVIVLVLSIFALHAQSQAQAKPVELSVGNLLWSAEIPSDWGDGAKLPLPEGAASFDYIPVIDPTMQVTGISFSKPAPKGDFSPGVTFGLVAIPPKFEDDKGSVGPSEEREPDALTSAQKQKAVDVLRKIFESKKVDPKMFITEKVEPIEDLTGGWWGSPDALLDVVSINYFENAGGTLRGVAFFFTEGQDSNFSLGYRIVLISKTNAVVVADCPLFNFEKIASFNKEMGNATDDSEGLIRYRKGEKYVGDRSKWSETPMGKLVGQFEEIVKASKVAILE